jgi:nucleoside-diphosphate-sugar epimerase
MSYPKRALITGLNGFTGHYVKMELENSGFEVHGIGEQAHSSPRYTQVNLLNPTSLKEVLQKIQPHVVIHLAGLAFVGSNQTEKFYLVNTIGTLNLLEAIHTTTPHIECILLASSANVYGNSSEKTLTESTKLSPTNDYAVSKVAMEHMARLWFNRLPIIITRPFNYTGVGQSTLFLLPKIVDHFQRRTDYIELGNLDVFRDFSDVRSIAYAYRKLIQNKPINETINICSGNLYSLHEIINIMEEITNHKIEIRVNPAFIRPNEVQRLQGSFSHLRHLIQDWSCPTLTETLTWMYSSKSKGKNENII